MQNVKKFNVHYMIFKKLKVVASSFAYAFKYIFSTSQTQTKTKLTLLRSGSVIQWKEFWKGNILLVINSFFLSSDKLSLRWETTCACLTQLENNTKQQITIAKSYNTNGITIRKGGKERECMWWAILSWYADLVSFQSVLGLNQGQEYTEGSPYVVEVGSQQKWQFKDLCNSPLFLRGHRFHIQKGLSLD